MYLRVCALKQRPGIGKLQDMRRRNLSTKLLAIAVLELFILAARPAVGSAQPSKAAVDGFAAYIAKVEARLARQHNSAEGFLVNAGSNGQTDARLRRGELIIEQLTPAKNAELPGALLHHWRGSAFVAGATARDFERLMKDFGTYPQRYSPQVVRAAILSPRTSPVPDHFIAMMRVRQKHVLTVVMDMTYDINYGHLDAQHGYSISRSTKIAEIADAGTSRERALAPSEEHGYLWRLNTYWSYEERDGGLYMQIESISLTRGIPTGLGWIIKPFVVSVPRESLEFTLRATCKALQK
jgi:hypothetical protein